MAKHQRSVPTPRPRLERHALLKPWVGVSVMVSSYRGHKPREMRGPIETSARHPRYGKRTMKSQAARNARPY